MGSSVIERVSTLACDHAIFVDLQKLEFNALKSNFFLKLGNHHTDEGVTLPQFGTVVIRIVYSIPKAF